MSKSPRFFLGEHEIVGDNVYISGSDVARHARKVLRLSVKDEVELFDGEGNVFSGAIEKLTKELMIVKVSSSYQEQNNRPHIILAQALPKAGKMDQILRMNTEIGVKEFLLFESEYSVVKREHLNEKKLERYKKVIEQAERQSQNNFMPIIDPVVTFEDLMLLEADFKIILTMGEPNSEHLFDIKSKLSSEKKVVIVVGPEGGFSPKEVKKAEENGFMKITLKTPVLRTETAGVVVCGFFLI